MRARAHDDVDLCVASEITARGALPRSNVLHKSRFTTGEVEQALQRLHAQGQIFLNDQIAAEIGAWRKLRSRAIELIDGSHKTQPERSGLELNDLRAALRDQVSEVIEALVADLCADDFVRARSTIARRTHRSALPSEMEPSAKNIRERLSTKPFDPPARNEIAPEAQSQSALRFLIEQGEAIEIGADVVLSREAFAKMKAAIIAFLQRRERATVSELRQELQTSRRIMVPMLELLDAQKVTRRAGDKRALA
jgi:selenocysteine-specific elongation factor